MAFKISVGRTKALQGRVLDHLTTFLPSLELVRKAWAKGNQKYLLLSLTASKPSIQWTSTPPWGRLAQEKDVKGFFFFDVEK